MAAAACKDNWRGHIFQASPGVLSDFLAFRVAAAATALAMWLYLQQRGLIWVAQSHETAKVSVGVHHARRSMNVHIELQQQIVCAAGTYARKGERKKGIL